MKLFSICPIRSALIIALSLLLWSWCPGGLHANPTGGTVTQGTATFSTSGSQFNINQTTANAYINWNSFNINQGETVNFYQPSASSVTWNYITDPNGASTINGNLNANGYVILQNPNGFSVGGSAVLNTHGLIMTTASTPMPNLSDGGAWSFNAPPPTAKIINYGQINIAGGGTAYLIASDIENNGTISAPGGKIGLYAGQQVLVSTSPDGRGLSAQVTLPQGSVNNQGQLIADAGSIVALAQTVNQGGLIQADSVQNVNGTIELVASGSLNLEGISQIKANGDATAAGTSPGGFVVLNAGNNTFADTSGSTISVSGANGGQNGILEIFGNGVTAGSLQSSYGNPYALLINPFDMTLSSGATSAGSNPNLNINTLANYSQIDLQALDNITLNSAWSLANASSMAGLSLTAGNNLALNGDITAGNNWNVSLTAGTEQSAGGINLNGSSTIQAQNGGINLFAANNITVNSGAVRTVGGGNINVTTLNGNVNTGTSTSGFNYISKAPYFTPFSVNTFLGTVGTSSSLGGISTAAGGNVTITAGGDVTSYLPTGTGAAAPGDAGTGAFGSQPGNVTITAGGNVYGHYVAVNGAGEINAGQDIGTAAQNVALSLVAGSWNLDAPSGNIYLQEVRNPNGVFNTQGTTSTAKHLFNYDPQAALNLTAGDGVYLTGLNLPRTSDALVNGVNYLPILLPPTLNITAGAGGVTLENNFTLYPSVDGNLQITTTDGGNFSSDGSGGATYELLMSDSSNTHWFNAASGAQPFSSADHGATPVELGNFSPVLIDISGSMENIILQTTKATQITVGGDMAGCSFYGQNLHAGDLTSITVGGQISNPGSFNYVTLSQGIQNLPLTDLPPNTANNWQTALTLAVDPARVAALTIPSGVDPSQYAGYLNQVLLFGNSLQSSFAYDPTTLKLTFIGSMSQSVLNALDQPLTVVRYDANGNPLVNAAGHFVTDTINWVAPASIASLYTLSQGAPSLGNSGGGYVVGGMGAFDVTAGSISLGNSYGILSLGNGNLLGLNYSYLTPYLQSQPGATINVTVAQDQTVMVNGVATTLPSLNMPSSTIAAIGGGDVNVQSTGGSMDLGSQYLVQFEAQIMSGDNLGLGIYTSGGGKVNVTAQGNINVDSSRIATFNGGDIFIESFAGDVNAGSGGNVSIPINVFSPLASSLTQPFEYVYANGIVAQTLVNATQVPGSATVPGNITVKTPQGSISASQGGVLQEALNGNISAGPTITLEAGTPNPAGDWNSKLPPLYGPPQIGVGNIDLGNSGVIGGTVVVRATGKVTGLLISSKGADINANSLGSLTVLSGGPTVVVSGQASSGEGITIIGVGGVSVSGIGTGANLLGPNVTVNGGAAQSTLGNAATATSTSQSAVGTASNDSKQQVAGDTSEDDDQKKKKKPQIRKVGRVTVILAAATPGQ
jgi:filamentous hemagglutinin family protein